MLKSIYYCIFCIICLLATDSDNAGAMNFDSVPIKIFNFRFSEPVLYYNATDDIFSGKQNKKSIELNKMIYITTQQRITSGPSSYNIIGVDQNVNNISMKKKNNTQTIQQRSHEVKQLPDNRPVENHNNNLQITQKYMFTNSQKNKEITFQKQKQNITTPQLKIITQYFPYTPINNKISYTNLIFNISAPSQNKFISKNTHTHNTQKQQPITSFLSTTTENVSLNNVLKNTSKIQQLQYISIFTPIEQLKKQKQQVRTEAKKINYVIGQQKKKQQEVTSANLIVSSNLIQIPFIPSIRSIPFISSEINQYDLTNIILDIKQKDKFQKRLRTSQSKQRKQSIQQKETIQVKDIIEPKETIQSKEMIEPKLNIQLKEIIQPNNIIQSKEKIQSKDIFQLKQKIQQSKDRIQPKERVQPKVNIHPAEPKDSLLINKHQEQKILLKNQLDEDVGQLFNSTLNKIEVIILLIIALLFSFYIGSKLNTIQFMEQSTPAVQHIQEEQSDIHDSNQLYDTESEIFQKNSTPARIRIKKREYSQHQQKSQLLQKQQQFQTQ